MRHLSRLVGLLATASLVGFSACGGGSGGVSDPTIPGSLVAIAFEGALAPGTTGGTFGPFTPSTQIDVADGGYTAFTADVIAGTTTKGLFVARPDGVVVDVYLKGQAVPAPGVGNIDVFEKIWISPGNGTGAIVTALVTITGGSVEGLISARVPAAAAVTDKSRVIYRAAVLPARPAGGAPGTLTGFNQNLIQIDDDGDVFFYADGSSLDGIWTVSRLGASLTAVAVQGDTGPTGGTLNFDFNALGIDGAGAVVAYAVTVLGGPTHAIIATNSTASLGVIVSQNGSTPPSVGARTFENVYDTGPLYVTNSGGTAYVIWQGDLTASAPDRGVFLRQVTGGNILTLGSLQTMVYPGQAVSGLGLGAFISDIELLNGSIDPNRIPVRGDIVGGTGTRALFSAPDPSTLSGVVADGQTVPSPGGTTFTANFPSLTLTGIKHGDYLGSQAFSAALTDGSSGVYWAIFGTGFFQVVRSGDAVPGAPGGTFGSFVAPSPVLTAASFVVFTASISGGPIPSGLFRQL